MSEQPVDEEAQEPWVPDVVYHYTSLSAMMSILKSQTIWATDIGYLNDVSEQSLLLGMVDEHLSAFALERNLDATPFCTSGEKFPNAGPFVASFSGERDSLHQWRSYCPIANGVSIGFRTDCLRQAKLDFEGAPHDAELTTADIFAVCNFKAVEYVGPGQSEVGRRVLETAYSEALLTAEMGAKYRHDDVFREVVEAEATFYKHRGFMNEAEYRLVLPSGYAEGNRLAFRWARSTLVPYVSLHIPPSKNAELVGDKTRRWDAVTEIVVGPTPNRDLTMKAVSNFCRSIGLFSAPASASSIPYRDW